MCRFAVYLGPEILLSSLLTEPSNSLINQSVHSLESAEPLNGDGFGVAWYVPALRVAPAVFKDLTPAWNNLNLLNLAGVTASSCILAHVRAASPGMPVTRLNCHPFSWGPFAFMHNGRIGGFDHLKRPLTQRLSNGAYLDLKGSTDSEHLFALFRDHYLNIEHDSRLEGMVEALIAAIATVEELRREIGVDDPAKLNLAVADGSRAVVCRYASDEPERANSLYFHAGGYSCEDQVARVLPEGDPNSAVLVASEPLNEGPSWQQVPPNHLVVVDEELTVRLRPIELSVDG